MCGLKRWWASEGAEVLASVGVEGWDLDSPSQTSISMQRQPRRST